MLLAGSKLSKLVREPALALLWVQTCAGSEVIMKHWKETMQVRPPTALPAEADSGVGETSAVSEGSAPAAKLAQQQFPYVVKQTRTGSARPVFVVGCPRSGTTLLYHMILSSGDFAIFPFESDTFRILAPRFPGLMSVADRKKLLDFWLGSENGTRSGLDRSDIEQRTLEECRTAGDFLRIVMEALCRKQCVHRWAEKTPDHTLYIAQIKHLFPDALVVHVIRDGRDAALSLANFGRISPIPWEMTSKLLSFGIYWKWMVQKGRAAGRTIAPDYYELHFEDLVQNPQETLARLGEFIDHEMNYERILQVGVGSVSRPDSSFGSSSSAKGFKPVGRWNKYYSLEELARFEALVGDCLEEVGYALATSARQKPRTAVLIRAISSFYTLQLEGKHRLKVGTPLGRLAGWRR